MNENRYEPGIKTWYAPKGHTNTWDEWVREFNALFEDLPEDMLLTLADCHQ